MPERVMAETAPPPGTSLQATNTEENCMKKKLLAASLALAFGVGSGYVVNTFAQAKPEVLVKQRQAAMTLIGKYWGPLGAMASGKAPYNAEVVARNAVYLDALTQMPWDGFAADTKDTAEKTRALPAVFTETAKFKEGQDRLRGAVTKLVAASKGGEDAFKAAAGEVGKACAACHENFRAK
jgi:cytochrome c556